LQENLNLGKPNNDLGDHYVLKIQASAMLARWSDDIETAVEEGNNCEEYSCILKPGPKNEAERLAFTLIEFFCPPPCAATIDLTQQTENKEGKNKCENTVQILNGTALGDGITLTYYSSSDSKEDDLVKGTATTLRKTKTDQGDEADTVCNDKDNDISWFVVLKEKVKTSLSHHYNEIQPMHGNKLNPLCEAWTTAIGSW